MVAMVEIFYAKGAFMSFELIQGFDDLSVPFEPDCPFLNMLRRIQNAVD